MLLLPWDLVPDGCQGPCPDRIRASARFGTPLCLGESSVEPEAEALGLWLHREAQFCAKLEIQRWRPAPLEGDGALVAERNRCRQHGVCCGICLAVAWCISGPSCAQEMLQVMAALGLRTSRKAFGCFSSPFGVETP